MATKKKSLKEDLEAPPSNYYGGICKIQVILDELDDDDKESLLKAVEKVRNDRGQGRARAFSTKWLTAMLIKNGHNIGESTVRRHINKECPCERSI